MKRKTLKTQENKTERRHEKVRECARRTPFSYSFFVGLVFCDSVQIRLNVAIQNEVCIGQRVDPLAYADLVLNGDVEAYLNAVTEYQTYEK